ncbi:hypothetical protein FW774_03485 (plasmid) [Pedobacter sp. BS3]|uniref:hypothetical protein n=1 Tax=Pedobacter sp. BS3 TaxID=2567937 RepID=UPI0011F08E6E|nr:hypothetical protein [Pedobacter sp. BS3]TZF86126.1 hypothetical protein FW774_03485 [Pedobacter sp. BS3]
MKTCFILGCALFGMAACKNNTSKNGASAAKDISGCYHFIHDKDTVFLHLTAAGKTVTGTLSYNYFEKDKSTGSIKGKLYGDTIIADYRFTSEGMESVRQVALLKKGDTLVEGYGDVTEQNGKMVFTNPDSLVYNNDNVLQRTDCP